MATPILVRSVLPYTTGLPADVVVNDFAVDVPDGVVLNADPWVSFFNDEHLGTDALCTWLSPFIDRGTDRCLIQVYALNVNGDPNGSPIATYPWTLGATAATSSLPLENCVAASYYAASGGAVLARRRRGRIFLGPFTGAALTVDEGSPHVAAGVVATIVAASSELQADIDTAGGTWCVWSRGGEKPTPGTPGLFPIIGGYVDNAWDTQRRRGVDATSRSPWAVP